jgi:hypothetical protein
MARDKSQAGQHSSDIVPQVQQEHAAVFDDDSMFNAADPQADALSPKKRGSDLREQGTKSPREKKKRRKAA